MLNVETNSWISNGLYYTTATLSVVSENPEILN